MKVHVETNIIIENTHILHMLDKKISHNIISLRTFKAGGMHS
jgi:hypothetical protein